MLQCIKIVCLILHETILEELSECFKYFSIKTFLKNFLNRFVNLLKLDCPIGFAFNFSQLSRNRLEILLKSPAVKFPSALLFRALPWRLAECYKRL